MPGNKRDQLESLTVDNVQNGLKFSTSVPTFENLTYVTTSKN